jgi:hypothetical protein
MHWDREIRTDVKINANRPHFILYDKQKSEVTITEVVIPLTSNEVTITDLAIPLTSDIQKAYTAKISKYNELAQEI